MWHLLQYFGDLQCSAMVRTPSARSVHEMPACGASSKQRGRRNLTAFLVIVGTTGPLLNGCQHTRPSEDRRSSLQFLTPSTVPREVKAELSDRKQVVEEYRPASPIGELVLPKFPKNVPRGGFSFIIVGARVTIGPTGIVTEVTPSLLTPSTPTAYSSDFWAAVEAAVRQWRFHPAEIVTIEWVSDPAGDYRRARDVRSTDMVVEARFTFTSSGKVFTSDGRSDHG
jgi:hypothetical protein